MFCPSCGQDNLDTAKYCGRCGTSFAPGRDETIRTRSSAGVGTRTVSDAMKIGVAVVSALIPFVGIIAGILYLVNEDPAKKAIGKLWLAVGCLMLVVYWFVLSSPS